MQQMVLMLHAAKMHMAVPAVPHCVFCSALINSACVAWLKLQPSHGCGRRFDHDIKGQGIYAYVTLHDGHEYSDAIRKDLIKTVREQIGAFAAPDVIHWAPGARGLIADQPSPIVPSFVRSVASLTSLSGIDLFYEMNGRGWSACRAVYAGRKSLPV